MTKWMAMKLEGPVETIAGKLTVSIPLSEGGSHFIDCTRSIAHVDLERDCIDIFIPDWLALKFGIGEGSRVVISNADGKFSLWLA
jgi:hypothetical protein